jgi:hypothetical protein
LEGWWIAQYFKLSCIDLKEQSMIPINKKERPTMVFLQKECALGTAENSHVLNDRCCWRILLTTLEPLFVAWF